MAEHNKKQLASINDIMPLIQEQLVGGGSVNFSPRGVSMLPMLRPGVDSVVLSPLKGGLKKYDLPLYRRDDGNYVLHRVVKTGDSYTCIGDNQYFAEKGVRHDQIIAVVTAFTRRGHSYTVTDTGYRLYCRFWHYSRPLRRVLRAIKHKIAGLSERRG